MVDSDFEREAREMEKTRGRQMMPTEKLGELTPELLAHLRKTAELCERENRLMFIHPRLVMIPLLDGLEAKQAAAPEAGAR